ncbi:uncharacterized protein LOC114241831 [Bombyx mandarina]|uniref:Uncharacterized protein LOC114241831 n=1 Tax=Bombyx mandarina TaxID=7092 RepID=A0A6J2JHX2_BOMMA|nr:uncharacterized protein LOC114241831 [Bombyx mandarina]
MAAVGLTTGELFFKLVVFAKPVKCSHNDDDDRHSIPRGTLRTHLLYQPIVLLDVARKLLERAIAARIVRHVTGTDPDLSAEQYGFSEGRSTIDAFMRVRALSDKAVAWGGVAFNTLPWSVIAGTLEYHGVPTYLRRLVGF